MRKSLLILIVALSFLGCPRPLPQDTLTFLNNSTYTVVSLSAVPATKLAEVTLVSPDAPAGWIAPGEERVFRVPDGAYYLHADGRRDTEEKSWEYNGNTAPAQFVSGSFGVVWAVTDERFTLHNQSSYTVDSLEATSAYDGSTVTLVSFETPGGWIAPGDSQTFDAPTDLLSLSAHGTKESDDRYWENWQFEVGLDSEWTITDEDEYFRRGEGTPGAAAPGCGDGSSCYTAP